MIRKNTEGEWHLDFLPTTRKARAIALQAVVLIAVLLVAGLLIANLQSNLKAGGINLGFGFLLGESGFDVNESLIPYSASSSYLAALVVGTLNTVHLTLACIVLSTAIGVAAGLLRLSRIKVFALVCRLYIECMRNLPKLLILLAIYVLLVVELPVAREAVSFFDLAFLSNRGFNFPSLEIDVNRVGSGGSRMATVLYLAAAGLVWFHVARRFRGHLLRFYAPAILIVAGWFMVTGGVTVVVPEFSGFDFVGGSLVSLPFLSLLIALGTYHGAQVAEVVRSGIQAVPQGQAEAGKALGLTSAQISWLIVLPQALRVMIPPMTNQYLNILKNTSIGLAVGYSDLVSIMNTSINQTFRPVELMLLTMAVYLFVGVAASVGLNVLNQRVQLRER